MTPKSWEGSSRRVRNSSRERILAYLEGSCDMAVPYSTDAMSAPHHGPLAARGRAPRRGTGRSIRRALLALAGLLGATSCLSSPDHDGVPVDILQGHRHSAYCGHYYHDFGWYFVKDHHHGEDCGHVLRYGQWTIE